MGLNRASAEWAIGMRPKPGVDAFHVESVFAFGQDAASLFVFEPRQAHSAFQQRVMSSGGGVDEGREGFEDRKVQALMRRDVVRSCCG